MRRLIAFLSTISVLAAMAACTPEENKTGGNENAGVKTVHVTDVSLNRTSATIKEGESITLVATVTPDNADNRKVTWSSSSDAVATVDNSGKVTGVKAGSATITATTEDGGKKATCALSVEANLAPSVTVEANHISAISAVLSGKANLGSTVAADLKVGFQFSKSAGILPSNSTTVEATDADANYNYTIGITGLEPDTKYYFRSFVRQNGQDTYGETKEFSTKDVASLLETGEASDVETTRATLNAKLDLTDVLYSTLSYGFLWSNVEGDFYKTYKCTIITENTISAVLTNLSHETQYWYKACVQLDNQIFYGEVKTFTTVISGDGETPAAETFEVGSVFPAWEESYLDIHSINGGRGEGFYYIFPDGTTMLCDAAGAPPVEIANNGGTASRPSRSIGSGTVIAHYIQHFAPAVANGKVDYFITSHYHGDHIGAWRTNWDSYGWTPYDKNGQAVSTLNMEAGGFYRNGVAEVGMLVPFAKVLDRGDWADPPSGDYVDDGGQKRYLLYVNYLDYAARTQGTVRETLRVGRSDQIVQTKDPNKYKTFSVRTVASGGKIWTGSGTDVNTSYVPSSSEILNRIKSGLGVNENIWSSVLLVSYGKFDWFTGGDIQYTGMSSTSWFDIETPISKALHKVEAMKACHHSTANTNSSNLLNVLKPDVYIASTWQTVQPNPATIKRVLAANANTRIYTTNLDASNIATLRDGGVDPSKFIATSGHVVIRVNASGKYWIAVLDDTNEKYLVKSVSGPFTSN